MDSSSGSGKSLQELQDLVGSKLDNLVRQQTADALRGGGRSSDFGAGDGDEDELLASLPPPGMLASAEAAGGEAGERELEAARGAHAQRQTVSGGSVPLADGGRMLSNRRDQGLSPGAASTEEAASVLLGASKSNPL